MQPSLHIALRQQQVLAPQLRQSLKLLQLTSIELETAVTQALEENMFLEVEENLSEAHQDTDIDQAEPDILGNDSFPTDEEHSINDTWGDMDPLPPKQTSLQGAEDSTRIIEQLATETSTLGSFLRSQVVLLHFNPQETACASAIIDAIDDEGYLTTSIDNIAQALGLETPLAASILKKIQQSTPTGMGACTLQERLLMQLNEQPMPADILDTAKRIISEHLDLLARKDFNALKKRLSANPETLRQAIAQIQSLNPHPVAHLASSPTEAITPDIFVSKKQGQWVLALNERIIPRLQINSVYANQIKLLIKSEQEPLQMQLTEAKQFIKGLQNRFETLAHVAKIVIEHQGSFLEHGEAMLKPLNLAAIAQKMSVHESTVSRAMAGKYMQTPHGVFELKQLLSHNASNQTGTDVATNLSATALRTKIRILIENEPKIKPYNDELIAKKLQQEQGIKIARRTVTKYREALRIPSSRERKRQTTLTTDL